MSVERLFFSASGEVYRLGQSIMPGQISLVFDEMDSSRPFIISACHESDEGGVALGLSSEDIVGEMSGEITIPLPALEKVRAIKPMTGIIFKEKIQLIDGDVGLVVIQHISEDQIYCN